MLLCLVIFKADVVSYKIWQFEGALEQVLPLPLHSFGQINRYLICQPVTHHYAKIKKFFTRLGKGGKKMEKIKEIDNSTAPRVGSRGNICTHTL